MHKSLKNFLAAREEPITVGDRRLVARELEAAADTAAFLDQEDLSYKLIVRCVFEEDGSPAFTDDDIQTLKSGSRVKLQPLVDAVNRVNGLDVRAEAKNSDAGPGAG